MGGGPVDSSQTGEHDGVQLVYSKSKVYAYHKDSSTAGYVAIFHQDCHFIAWVPEQSIAEDDIASYLWVEVHASTVSIQMPMAQLSVQDDESSHGLLLAAMEDVASVLVHPPTLTQWHGSMHITLRDGTAWPPLWFHDDESKSSMESTSTPIWGGEEIVKWIKNLVKNVEPSPSDPNLLLLNATGPRLEDSVLSFADDEAPVSVAMSKHSTQDASDDHPLLRTQEDDMDDRYADKLEQSGTSSLTHSRVNSDEAYAMDPLIARVKQAKWHVLDRFAQVTQYSRETAASILVHPLARPVVPYLPSAVVNFADVSSTNELIQDYQPAALYLAKWAASAIQRSREAQLAPTMSRTKSFYEDVELNTIWRQQDTVGEDQIVTHDGSQLPPFIVVRQKSLTAEEWFSWLDDEGRLSLDRDDVCRRVFAGGMEHDLRPFVWPFLLGVYPWYSSERERQVIKNRYRHKYDELCAEWLRLDAMNREGVEPEDPQQATQLKHLEEQRHRIEKDVLRTDRNVPEYMGKVAGDVTRDANKHPALGALSSILIAYHLNDESLGYVQGMSDLLSPLYVVLGQDEAITFACFVRSWTA